MQFSPAVHSRQNITVLCACIGHAHSMHASSNIILQPHLLPVLATCVKGGSKCLSKQAGQWLHTTRKSCQHIQQALTCYIKVDAALCQRCSSGHSTRCHLHGCCTCPACCSPTQQGATIATTAVLAALSGSSGSSVSQAMLSALRAASH